MEQIEHKTWEAQQKYWIQMLENAKLENLMLSKKFRKMLDDEEPT